MVFRWEEGMLHHYPNKAIAASWDEDWSEALVDMYCDGMHVGNPMSKKGGEHALEGGKDPNVPSTSTKINIQ